MEHLRNIEGVGDIGVLLKQLQSKQEKEEKAGDVDMDLMSGYPTMHLSFILDQMAPLHYIQSDAVKRQHEGNRLQVNEQFQDVDTVRMERYGTSLENLTAPRLVNRTSIQGDAREHSNFDIDIESREFQWLMVAMEKKACYHDDAGADDAKFIIEADDCAPGFVRLRIRKPKDTKAFKTQYGGKWYISSKKIAVEFKRTMEMFGNEAMSYDFENDDDTMANKTGEKVLVYDRETSKKTFSLFTSEPGEATGDSNREDDMVLVYQREKANKIFSLSASEQGITEEKSHTSEEGNRTELKSTVSINTNNENETETSLSSELAPESNEHPEAETEVNNESEQGDETHMEKEKGIAKSPDQGTDTFSENNNKLDQSESEATQIKHEYDQKISDLSATKPNIPTKREDDTIQSIESEKNDVDMVTVDTKAKIEVTHEQTKMQGAANSPDTVATNSDPDADKDKTEESEANADVEILESGHESDTVMAEEQPDSSAKSNESSEFEMMDISNGENSGRDEKSTSTDRTSADSSDFEILQAQSSSDDASNNGKQKEKAKIRDQGAEQTTEETEYSASKDTTVETKDERLVDSEHKEESKQTDAFESEQTEESKQIDSVESRQKEDSYSAEPMQTEESELTSSDDLMQKEESKQTDSTKLVEVADNERTDSVKHIQVEKSEQTDSIKQEKKAETKETDSALQMQTEQSEQTDSSDKVRKEIKQNQESGSVENTQKDEKPDEPYGSDDTLKEQRSASKQQEQIQSMEESTSDHTDTVDSAKTEPAKETETQAKPRPKKAGMPVMGDPETDRLTQDTPTGDKTSLPPVEMNVILSFPCASWPKIATKWKSRERRSDWPSEQVRANLESKGCLFIATAHEQSKEPDIEWQMIICIEELEKSLNDTQRQCYILLKLVRFHSFDMPKILTPQHMLFLLFWVCEDIPQSEWVREKLGLQFTICLDKLLEFVADGHFPHYFYTDCNLLSGISVDHLDHLAKSISKVRKEPVQTFYSFSAQYLTPYYPVSCSFRELFADLEENKDKISFKRGLQLQQQCLQRLLKQFIHDKRFPAALSSFEQLKELSESLGKSIPQDSESYFNSIALESTLDDGIELFEFLIQHYPKSKKLHSTYGNMGCYLHGKYAESTDEEEQSKWRQKAKNAFESAIQAPSVSPATKTDYANFLLHTKDYEKAIEILKEVVEGEEDSTTGNLYSKQEQTTVDPELRPWIEQNGELKVVSTNYSQYMLIKCYIATEQQDKTKPVLKMMNKFCKSINRQLMSANRRDNAVFILLGYAAKGLERYKLAMETFRELNDIRPSALCQSSLEECVMLWSSMETEDAELSDDDMKEAMEAVAAFAENIQLPEQSKSQSKTEDDTTQSEVDGSKTRTSKEDLLEQEIELLLTSADMEIKAGNFTGAIEYTLPEQSKSQSKTEDDTTQSEVDGSKTRTSKEDLLEQEIELLLKSADKKIKAGNFTGAIEDYEEFCSKGPKTSKGETSTAEMLFNNQLSELEAGLAIEAYQFLIEKFPESERMHSYYNNMACMYHVMYANSEHEGEKDEIRRKTKQAFEQARKHPSAKERDFTDYANFLFATGEYATAIELTEQTIGQHLAHAPSEWCERMTSYGRTELRTVDENIQSEIEYAGKIIIVPLIHSFYLLVNCCVKMDKQSEAKDVLQKMKDACDKLIATDRIDTNYKISSQTLLGNVSRDLEDFETAKAAFEWVYENDNRRADGGKNTVAQENMQMCEALLISMQM